VYNHQMKRIFIFIILIFLAGACDSWSTRLQPFPNWTPIPSRTPGVVTATPIIISPPISGTITPSSTNFASAIVTLTYTEIPSPTVTPAPTLPTNTPTLALIQSVAVEILGCNTSIDITHGMGEVTNAYVIVKNTGNVDLINTCALLRAIDEDREHPDKKVCVANLPAQYQATLKLTVDSAYQQNTAIQVDASSNDILLLRVDRSSCAEISLFGGAPADVGLIKPIQQ